MANKLDRRLNLVLEVTTDEGKTLWVHHTPIRREIFQNHFLVLTKTIADMYSQTLPPPMCQRIALLMLRKTADAMGEDVKAQVEGALLPEIWRLTNVLVPQTNGTGSGWTTLPLEKVIADQTISEEDADEVKNHVVFFTAASWVHKRQELQEMIYPMLDASGSRTTSSTPTEYLSSLPTSTPAASSGETAKPSSIPS